VGQKSHPYGLRLGYIKDWKAKWFAQQKDFGKILIEDLKIRKLIKKELKMAGVADITIERSAGKVRVWIFTARPGIVIGRGGQEINRIRDLVGKLTQSEVFLDIKEVKIPQIDAQLVADNVTLQLERRVAFRRAMKKAVASAMSRGAGGIKIRCKGRLGGSEIARTEGYKEGKVPLNTFRADVCYGFSEALTTYGTIGVKVWIYHGDVLVKQEQAKRAKAREEMQAKKISQFSEKKAARQEQEAHEEVAVGSEASSAKREAASTTTEGKENV
jgi:small subunit ribosomal protein S3